MLHYSLEVIDGLFLLLLQKKKRTKKKVKKITK
jgi:hypothetical protein